MVKDNTQPATKKDLTKTEKVLRAELKETEKSLRKDLQATEQSLRSEIKLSTAEVKRDFKEELSKHTSKILSTFDKFLKEIVASREERVIVAGKLSEHEERIERLEKQVLPT